jgi:hypothetical protein
LTNLFTPHNTLQTIATDLGWSEGKVAMADKVWKEAEPEAKQAILEAAVQIIIQLIAI